MVFPRAAFSEMMGWHGASDGLVEIWNGMPFFSPVWARRPTRHVAAPRARHDVGDDAAAAPGACSGARSSSASRRRSTGARRSSRCRSRRSASSSTGSRFSPDAGRRRAARASIARFSPGGTQSPTPLVVAVGRLVPVKRFHASDRRAGRVPRRGIRSCARSIVGEGYEREALETLRRELGRRVDWISLPGLGRRRRADRPVPAGVGRRERVGARRLGDDAHRSRRVRHAGGRDAHRRPRGRGACTAHRPPRRRRRRRSRPRSTGSSPTTRCGPGSARRRAREPNELTWGATARGTLEVLAAEALRRRTT